MTTNLITMKYLAILAAFSSFSAAAQPTEAAKPKENEFKCAIRVGQKSMWDKAPANAPCETYVTGNVVVPSNVDSKSIKSIK